MLTRPPPAPRTRTTGRAPRGAQVRPFGGPPPRPPPAPQQKNAPPAPAAPLYRGAPPPSPRGARKAGGDLAAPVATGEPPGCLQPQPFTPLLLGGRIPAPLRIPHTSVICPQAADVTTRSLRVHLG